MQTDSLPQCIDTFAGGHDNPNRAVNPARPGCGVIGLVYHDDRVAVLFQQRRLIRL